MQGIDKPYPQPFYPITYLTIGLVNIVVNNPCIMKQLLLLASGISLCLAQLMAATVPVQTAQTVAVNFYKGNVANATSVSASLKYTRTEDDGIVDYYIFDI